MINSDDSLAVKDLLTAASPLIKSLVDTFVTPKLEKFRNRFALDKTKYYIPNEDHFQEYFHRIYKNLSIINTLVFNNSQRLLKDIFLPLTVYSSKDEKIRCRIEGFPTEISDEYGYILITDTAGMGKSTLMKRIFLDIVDNNIGIPIIVELRRLSKTKTLIKEIHEQLNSLNKEFDSNLLLELLSEGGFIIILDGYDEISLSERENVTSDIQSFISKASNNRFFITSRPEKALSSFGNFQEFKINSLKTKEAFELLRKYDNQGVLSTLLIKKLQEKDMKNIEEFLINPLLVSLLFTAFEHKQAIPFKKYLFYRQVYDANFESHDLTKGESFTHDKHSKLEIDDFHKVLRHIGYNCLKIQKIEFSKDELLKLIFESKDFCTGLNFNESDFLEDLISTVPLFTKDGNYYRWVHKSLQEYFAAQFIYLDSKEKQSNILVTLYNHPNIEKFINILDLYYDMDYKIFRNIIEFRLLEEFENHVNSYNFPDVNFDDVIIRIELCFLSTIILFKDSQFNKKSFFSDGVEDMLIKLTEKMGKRSDGILCYSPCTQKIYGIHYFDSKVSLIHLLENKKSPLVKLTSGKQTVKSTIKLNYQFTSDFEPVFLNNLPNNDLNKEPDFAKINQIIKSTRIHHFSINYKIALEQLDIIRASLKKESEDNFVLGGL